MYKNKGIAAIFKHNFIFLKHLKIFNNRILYKLQKGEQEYFVKELGWGGGQINDNQISKKLICLGP